MVNLIAVFSDTQRLCEEDEDLSEAIRQTIARQYVVREPKDMKPLPAQPRFASPANVVVSRKRSFEAAQAYPHDRVCVLNFASSTHVGGGVRHGARAQEECLCRCSTLYFAIGDKETAEKFHYYHQQLFHKGKMTSLHNDDCIFSPDIKVIKTDTESPCRLEKQDRYTVDVITCAAPNLSPFFGSHSVTDDVLLSLHKTRAKRILDIAVSEGEDVIILGAFGCGAFRNPPAVVAKAYQEILKAYLYNFKTSEFAIYCPPNSRSENYQAFRSVLSEYL